MTTLVQQQRLKQERWRRHFSKILNIQSDFDVEELSRVRQRPRSEMRKKCHQRKR